MTEKVVTRTLDELIEALLDFKASNPDTGALPVTCAGEHQYEWVHAPVIAGAKGKEFVQI